MRKLKSKLKECWENSQQSFNRISERLLLDGNSALISSVEDELMNAYQFVYVCTNCNKVIEYDTKRLDFFSHYYFDKKSFDKNSNVVNRFVNACTEYKCHVSTSYFEKPDNLFNTMIVSHGMMTGFLQDISGRKSIENLFGIAKNYNNPHFEICCSHKTQHIGKWGIYLKGTHTVVSNIDLYSQINNGKRTLDRKSWKTKQGVIYRREDYDYEEHDHSEHIIIPRKIVGVWITKHSLNNYEMLSYYKELEKLCKLNHWILHLVK